MTTRLHDFAGPSVVGLLMLSGCTGLRPAAPTSTAPARLPGRMVFAHYMVCIPTAGGGATVDDYRREIREAQSRGVDGFALNCGGWTLKEPHYKQRCLLIYEAARQLGSDFQVLISADYATGLSFDETRDMVETFRGHPNQFRHEGKPVLSTFAGGTALTEFVRQEFRGDRAIVFVPFYYPTPAAELPNQAQVDQVFNDNPSLDGFFHFGAAGAPERIAESNDRLARRWLGAGKLFMSPVTPLYRGLGGNYRVYESRGFEGMARQWESAIATNSTWVEIVTWNDWGEASYVAPFGPPEQTEHWGGHWGPMLAHTAFLDASRYYIDWYRTGVRPTLTEDRVFYFYRLHPKTVLGRVKPDGSEQRRPSGADQLEDRIFATVYLQTPATLRLEAGDAGQTFALEAGVHHVSIPMAPGRPRVVLERQGRTLIEKTCEQAISATDAWGNFNTFAGSAAAPAAATATAPRAVHARGYLPWPLRGLGPSVRQHALDCGGSTPLLPWLVSQQP